MERDKEREIASLLAQAEKNRATAGELTVLRALLTLYFDHPERYQRIPDIRDARPINTGPLPYRKEV